MIYSRERKTRQANISLNAHTGNYCKCASAGRWLVGFKILPRANVGQCSARVKGRDGGLKEVNSYFLNLLRQLTETNAELKLSV